MTRWVALLRSVNVGGSNRLPMVALRATFAALGYAAVATYIQSGNVVFDASDDSTEGELVGTISAGIADRHDLSVPVVVRSADELARVATSHPMADIGLDPKHLHVAFLDREPDPAALASVPSDRFEPDRWVCSGRELYLAFPNGSARSKMTIDRFEQPWKVTATARNLNTVRRLAAMSTPS